jgi:hypothetical protein
MIARLYRRFGLNSDDRSLLTLVLGEAFRMANSFHDQC